jgi:hypothetical protein
MMWVPGWGATQVPFAHESDAHSNINIFRDVVCFLCGLVIPRLWAVLHNRLAAESFVCTENDLGAAAGDSDEEDSVSVTAALGFIGKGWRVVC